MTTSLLTIAKMDALKRLCIEASSLPGDMAELGVYKGGAALEMARICIAPNRLFLFDTFEGMPESSGDDFHKKGEFSDTSLEAVQNLLSPYPHVVLCPGFFPSSFINNHQWAFIHLDADQYVTTAKALDLFWPDLLPGGIILLDDYGWHHCPGVKRAVEEWKEKNVSWQFSVTAPGQAMLRKEPK